MAHLLRVSRARLKLTQETIARRAHVSAKFVSQIENGHANPTIGVLGRVVELGLGLPLSAFFAGEDGTRDDLAQIRALLGAQTATMRRRALRVLRALVED